MGLFRRTPSLCDHLGALRQIESIETGPISLHRREARVGRSKRRIFGNCSYFTMSFRRCFYLLLPVSYLLSIALDGHAATRFVSSLPAKFHKIQNRSVL